jgi:hypothetical protein
VENVMLVRRPGSANGLQAGENGGGPMRPPYLLNAKNGVRRKMHCFF